MALFADIAWAMLVKYHPGDILGVMNWPELLETLRQRGWTQVLLARRLGVAQSHISDLKCGVATDTKHSTGEALKALLLSGERAPVSTPQAV